MKNRGIRPARKPLAVALVTGALVLTFVAMGATGASAASPPQMCPGAPGGQTQTGTANGANGSAVNTGPESGTIQGATGPDQAPPAGGQPADQGQVCTGGATGGVTTTQDGGPVCTIVLPEGAAPGTIIVVGQAQTGGTTGNTAGPASSCATQVINPAGSGTGSAAGNAAPGAGSTGTCSVAPPGNGSNTTVPPAEAGAQSAPGSETTVVGAAPAGDAAGQPQVCGGTVTNPAQAGGTTTPGNSPQSTGGAPTCAVVIDGSATAGTTTGGTATVNVQPGTVVVVGGQAPACPDAGNAPGTTRPGSAGTTGNTEGGANTSQQQP